MPAFAKKYDKADQRNVVIKSDSFSAFRTTRRGSDYGFTAGYPVDADIQEAAYNEAE